MSNSELEKPADVVFRGSNSWTNGQTDNQQGNRKRRVHFSQSTSVRMIENPEAFSTKFREFKRSCVKTFPCCFHIEVSPFREYQTQTDFEEKKGDLAKVGMPPKKRLSIGEIDLSELKSQLERIHKIANRINVAEAEEKLECEEKIEKVHNIEKSS